MARSSTNGSAPSPASSGFEANLWRTMTMKAP